MRRRIAAVLLGLVALATVAVGLQYLLGLGTVDYHRRLLGGAALPASAMPLYETLRRSLGAAFLAMGVTHVFFAREAVRGRSLLAILVFDATLWPLLAISNLTNGLHSPWWMNLALLSLTIGAARLSHSRGTGAEDAST